MVKLAAGLVITNIKFQNILFVISHMPVLIKRGASIKGGATVLRLLTLKTMQGQQDTQCQFIEKVNRVGHQKIGTLFSDLELELAIRLGHYIYL